MIDDILLDNRHKFIYCDENKKDIINRECLEQNVCLDNSILVYINDNGLPMIDSEMEVDKFRVMMFHDRYYDFLITFSIIDKLINNLDIEFLNKKFKRLFNMYSGMSKKEINNIYDLRDVLEYDKNKFFDGYIEYLSTGKMDFYDKTYLGFVMTDIFIKNVKRSIGLRGYFSLLIDYDNMSNLSMRVINKYINSRSNGYLSINVLCGEKIWNIFYDNQGYFIQNIHDYIEIDYSDVKRKVRHN